MSNYAMITSGGLFQINEASSHGTLIDIRYFVPVYDWRIDPTISPISPSTSADEISSVTNPGDTIPTGEIIWNIDTEGYTLSDSLNSVSLISGANTVFQNGVDIDIVSDSVQLQHQPINLYGGIPLSYTISATNVIFAPSAAGVSWQLESALALDGVNSRPTGTLDDFWSVVEFASLLGENGRSRGAFKCRLNKDVGKFKFNKLGLYAVTLDNNYEPYGDPFLFAQVIFPAPEIKSSLDQGGLDEIVVDVQLEMITEEVSWDSVVYGSQNDYWQKVTQDGSLHHSKGVYIGRYAPKDTNNRIAKTIITSWEDHGYGEDDDTIEFNKPQLALQNVTITTSGANTIRTGHFASFMVETSGNMAISLSADDGYYPSNFETYSYDSDPKNSSVYPYYTNKLLFGKHNKRWKTIYLGSIGSGDWETSDNRFVSYNNSYDGDVGGLNEPKSDLLAIDIHGGGIQIGRSPDDITRNDTTYGIRLIDRSIKVKNKYFSNAHLMGFDLKKENDESLIVSTSKPSTNFSTSASKAFSNIFMTAGALGDKFSDSECVSDEIYNLIKLSGYEVDINYYFDEFAEIHLVANGGINSYSPINLHARKTYGDYNFSILKSKNYYFNLKNERFLIAAGVKGFNSDNNLIKSSSEENFYGILADESVIELVSGKGLRVWGDITPIKQTYDYNNPLEVSRKLDSESRTGSIIGKWLDIYSCNGTFDNVRFGSYYEQPFSRFMSMNLNQATFSSVIMPQSQFSAVIEPSTISVENIFKYAKWARIGNLVILKFYLNLSFACTANQNAKLIFKIPTISMPGVNENNNTVFDSSDVYLNMEVEGNNATQYSEQSGTTEVLVPKFYHPIELIFSRDFQTGSESVEKETKVLVPAYNSINLVGQPNSTNEFGTMPYSNPFATYSIKFSVTRSVTTLNLTSLQSYLALYPYGGNPNNFDASAKSTIDYLIAAQAKAVADRSQEEVSAINSFSFPFYNWDSFKKQVIELYSLSTKINNFSFQYSQQHTIGRTNTFSLNFSDTLFRYEKNSTYDGSISIINNGHMSIDIFTNEFMARLNAIKGAIVKVKSSDFGYNGNEYLYLKIHDATNPFLNNYNSLDTSNKIGTLHAYDGYAPDYDIHIYVPMIKVWDMRLGSKKRWTFGTEGIVYDTWYVSEPSEAKTLINDNTWE